MSTQVYQLSGAGQASIPNKTIISTRNPTTNDIVDPNGSPYQILQGWRNTVANTVYQYAGGGIWVLSESGSGGPLDTLTGNTGGAIAPTGGNINIVGSGTTTVDGSGSTLTISASSSGFPITPYVVGPSGKAGYQTIQAAINAANLAGGGLVFIQPGSYSENLTLFSNVFLEGASFQDVTITGVHTPPSSGTLNFKDITFSSATHIFSSVATGSTAITVTYSNFTITNGYIFNLVNWTGALQLTLCGELGSANDGVVNNTGGSAVTLLNSTLGAGTANTMTTSGTVVINDAVVQCPWSAATGSSITVDAAEFTRTVTLANNSTGLFDSCRFSTGATAAITMSSSAAISISNTVINSSNNPAISGSGAGVLTLTDVSFLNNSLIAGTLTTAAGIIRGGNFVSQYVVGASPDAHYQTIQSAITAAAAAGGGLVFIQPGSYTENLTLSSGVFIQGSSFQDVTITGVHTPPTSGTINFENVTLASATDIFNSAAAGSTAITITYSNITVTNGYVFNLVNWTGALQLTLCGEVGSTTNGIVTNTGGSSVTLLNSTLGSGTANSMTTSGTVIINDAVVQCPWNAATGTVFTIDATEFTRTVTLSNNSTGLFDACRFSTGSTAAITMSSSAAVSLTTSTINSSNNPAIAGAGAGVLTLGSIVFLSNSSLSGTLTVAGATQRNGTLTFAVAGNKISTPAASNTTAAGANAFGTVTLSGGTATVATTAVTSSSIIMLTRQSVGATGAAALGSLSVGTITGSTSFVINAWQAANATALQASDVSIIGWMIIN